MDAPGLVHIVDDEESVRHSVDFLLRMAGYRTSCWSDGITFLRHFDAHEPSCIILDVRMPGIDGLEVQHRLNRRETSLPVIVVTGHGDVDLAIRAMKAGASDFIQKPFDREQLLRSIATAFRQLEMHAEGRERVSEPAVEIKQLTEREREVLDGLACGYPNQTIALDLGLTPRAVQVCRANLMSKLRLNSFADVLRLAFQAGLGSETTWRQRHGGSDASAQMTQNE